MNWVEKAKKIHNQSIIIDGHLDLGGIIYNNRKKGNVKVLENLFYEDFKKIGLKFVIAAIFVEEEFLPNLGLEMALKQISAIINDVKESNDKFVIVTSSEEMKKAIEDNKIGIIMSLEGAEPIGRDLDMLDIFYRLGVRALGLTWSRRNFVADGSYFRNPEEGIRGGLTPFGIKVVRKAEKLGIIIDVSHLNDKGFLDVIKYTEKSFIASHSNSRVINELTRNLTDKQIKVIGERGGVIGVNAYTSIVSENLSEQTIEKICDHIEHIIKIGGKESVGFGFDLCTLYYNNGKQLDVLKDHSDSILITAELLRRGLSENTIKKVIGSNFSEYLSRML